MEPSKEPPSGRPILIGAAVALAAGLASAVALLVLGRPGSGPPPASEGGLVVEAGPRGDARLAPGARLRCYVDGQLVGELTLEACARLNGVASGALDVGIDSSGAMGAGSGALSPLPSGDTPAPVEVLSPAGPGEPKAAPAAASTTTAACWRHTGADWRRLPGEMSQLACVKALFDGRCEPGGSASYGRWGAQTLRLVTGRAEVSNDNRTFRPLLEQSPNCSFAPAGGG